jgi:hypothetical protein
VEYEITPEPTPAEREALIQALERLLAGDPALQLYRSLWRESGIRENLAERENGD